MHPPLPYPTTDFIKHWATEHPDRIACHDVGLMKTWTYAELEGDVSAGAAHLADQGVQAGDRVAVLARNSVYLVILQHALMRLGATFVPFNWRLSRPELSRLVADCSPTILYTHRTHQDSSGAAASTSTSTSSATNPSATETTATPPPDGCRRLDLQVFIDALQDAREPPPPPITPRNVSDDAVATILYTSGTSGKPKGVVMTRSTMSCMAANFSRLGNLERSSKLLCDAPMFHVIGLVVAVWAPLSSCAVFVVSPRFDPAETNDRLAASSSDGGITHYFCVPQMADALSAAPNFNPEAWTSLEALFTGGAPNPASRINSWLARGVLMVNGYGTTETGAALGMPLSAETVVVKAGSVGRSPTWTEVEILDGDGNPVGAANVAGEIAIAGLNVSPGYWGGLSAADGRPVLLSLDGSGIPVHANGAAAGSPRLPCFRTGDVGYRDEDGFVYIMGRRKDVFISGGENVYPAEVEAALMEHPEVAEAAVVGVPDARWGEVGRAYIVLSQSESHDGCSDEEHPTSDQDLVEHCRGLIGAYKIPKQFRFVGTLPRTGSGKVMKHALRAEAAVETDATQ